MPVNKFKPQKPASEQHICGDQTLAYFSTTMSSVRTTSTYPNLSCVQTTLLSPAPQLWEHMGSQVPLCFTCTMPEPAFSPTSRTVKV